MEKLTRKIETDEHDTFEALEEAKKLGKTICNAAEVDEHVLKTREAILCSPLTVYAKKGEKLGESAKRGDLTFRVPKKFQGLDGKKCLLIEHPNFDYDEKTKTITVPDECKVMVEEMPEESGELHTMNAQGFPNGEKTGKDSDRRLWRTDYEFVGLLVRGDDYDDRRDVVAYYDPGYRFGVLVK